MIPRTVDNWGFPFPGGVPKSMLGPRAAVCGSRRTTAVAAYGVPAFRRGWSSVGVYLFLFVGSEHPG